MSVILPRCILSSLFHVFHKTQQQRQYWRPPQSHLSLVSNSKILNGKKKKGLKNANLPVLDSLTWWMEEVDVPANHYLTAATADIEDLNNSLHSLMQRHDNLSHNNICKHMCTLLAVNPEKRNNNKPYSCHCKATIVVISIE